MKRHQVYHWRQPLVVVSLALLLLMLLTACAGGPEAEPTPAAVASVTPPPVTAHRDKATVQYCGDVTGSYPATYFAAANGYLARSLQAAITANQDGVVFYASLINDQPENPVNSLPPIVIPSTPDWPKPPVIAPTPTPGKNPFETSQAVAKALAANDDAQRAYAAGVKQVEGELAMLRTQLQPQLDGLAHWSPNRNARNTSIFGCIGLASQRFAGVTGNHILVIASDLQNNSLADVTPRLRLDGVQVVVIDLLCTTVPSCEATKGRWAGIFHAAGAASWTFADPAKSETLPPLLGGNWPTA